MNVLKDLFIPSSPESLVMPLVTEDTLAMPGSENMTEGLLKTELFTKANVPVKYEQQNKLQGVLGAELGHLLFR